MKRLTLTIGIGLFACAMASAQGPAAIGTTGTPPATAGANLIDTQGRSLGQAYLQHTPHGVLLKLELKNATPGIHSLHIHDVGRCDRPSFDSAGGHFNPTGRQHGFLNPRGPHAGDLPNIEVPTTTQLSVEYLVADVTLDPGPRSLLDANGSTIVIHAGKDDYMSDPAGESGDRLVCGHIIRSAAATAPFQEFTDITIAPHSPREAAEIAQCGSASGSLRVCRLAREASAHSASTT